VSSCGTYGDHLAGSAGTNDKIRNVGMPIHTICPPSGAWCA